jgi:hypothetical protein
MRPGLGTYNTTKENNMTAIGPLTVTRAAAYTYITSDLSLPAADANVVLDSLYSGASGTPKLRSQDSRAFRAYATDKLGSAESASALMLYLGIE